MSEEIPEVINDAPEIKFADKLKVQGEVLVPLLAHLRKELGKEQADKLMFDGLAAFARQFGRIIRDSSPEPNLVKLKKTIDQLDEEGGQKTRFLEADEKTLNFDVVDCKIAHIYRELGLGDIGFLLACSLDYNILPGLDPDIEMTRTQTIMQGASHCEFRMRIKDKKETKEMKEKEESS